MLPLTSDVVAETITEIETTETEAGAAVPPAQESATIDEDGMASSAERMTILRMVEQGKISAEDGARLLAALGERNQAEEQPRPNVFDTSRHLQIRVTDLGTDRQKVNVNLPVGLMQLAWRWLPGSAQTQVEKVQAAIDAGHVGKLLEVVDQDSGVRVEITLV